VKCHILNYEPNRTGGGWTAARYLAEGIGNVPYQDADIVLVTGATMATHDQVAKAKSDGKKIVLRVDNAVRDSRNRGTGMTRMKAFYDSADLVIFQSRWARDFLEPFLSTDGQSLSKNAVVILNGVDTKRFTPGTPKEDSYLYVRSSRDEGKQWIMAWYWFVNNPGTLEIVGKFSSENIDWNFDFYNGEKFRFMGEQSYMPDVYRRNKYFLYTYLNDACSNTLLEARASGCEIIDVYGMLKTGGAPEIMACRDISVERMIREYKFAMEAI
jgi:glycosyltransferase involved in cell wall biosynthesis